MCVPGQYVDSTRAQTPCAARLRKRPGELVCSSCWRSPPGLGHRRAPSVHPLPSWCGCLVPGNRPLPASPARTPRGRTVNRPAPPPCRCSWPLNTDSRKHCPSWTSATRLQRVGRTLARFLLTRIGTSELLERGGLNRMKLLCS